MLISAALKKNEILEEFKKYYYTMDMMYETGGVSEWVPDIQDIPDEGRFQYAVANKDNKLIGYIDFSVDWYVSKAYNFGIISFDRGNPIMGKDLYAVMNMLINEYRLHKIEWRMIKGNPVEKHYDKFCKKYNGNKYVLRDSCRDKYGNYHDDVIYEIILD